MTDDTLLKNYKLGLKLPLEERKRRRRLSIKKQEKRQTEIRAYLTENAFTSLTCKNCNWKAKIGRISTDSVRMSCTLCKDEWFISMTLPKHLIPKLPGRQAGRVDFSKPEERGGGMSAALKKRIFKILTTTIDTSLTKQKRHRKKK